MTKPLRTRALLPLPSKWRCRFGPARFRPIGCCRVQSVFNPGQVLVLPSFLAIKAIQISVNSGSHPFKGPFGPPESAERTPVSAQQHLRVNEPTRVFAPSATTTSSAPKGYDKSAGAKASKNGNPNALNGALVELILESISDKKGVDAVSLDLSNVPEAVADTFILCNGTSTTQVKAIAEHIDRMVREQTGEHPWHSEGYNNCEWVLIDYVDTVVHVFLPEKRQLYNLEELWGDAPLTQHAD